MNPHRAMTTLATELVSEAGREALRVGRQIPATVQGTQAVLVDEAGEVIGVAHTRGGGRRRSLAAACGAALDRGSPRDRGSRRRRVRVARNAQG